MAGFFIIALFFLATPLASLGLPSELAESPPPIYKPVLSKLLTPLEEILKREPEFDKLHGDGRTLLDECIAYVDGSGKQFFVYHTIDQALNEAGVNTLTSDSISFSKKTERVCLVLARTIEPDGTRIPVKGEAVVVKTPQAEDSDSVYDDNAELVIIYPKIKRGSLTESIIVVEDLDPQIPGEFTQTYPWRGVWPEFVQRNIVDLPQSYADRLTISKVGEGVPDPTVLAPSADRKRFVWEKLNTPGEPAESTRAPKEQIGPLLWLSTLKDWDQFAAWYSSMLKEGGGLSAELAASVDLWTKDAKTSGEIIRILYEKVAREVRYTALEFGKSSIQPYSANEVWERQYGDCKDKADLLAVMLAHKGIPAWVTLLSSEHAGLIHKGSADYRQFDHAIVAVGQKNGGYLFCDPTITYGEPGLLAPSDSDREVLIIQGSQAKWARTPPMSGAVATYSFDLQLYPDGKLTGTINFIGEGYHAASYRKYYEDLTRNEVLSQLEESVRGFFPNVEVVDVEAGAGTGAEPAPFQLRANLTLPGAVDPRDPAPRLAFSLSNTVLPELENYKRRRYPSFLDQETVHVIETIHLPPGWTAAALPPDFKSSSNTYDFTASWMRKGDAVVASFTSICKQSLLSPQETEAVGNAVAALRSWAARPITLAKNNAAISLAPPAPAENILADAVAAWLRLHQPSWWNQSDPKSAADPRLKRLEKILQNPDGTFTQQELAKAGFLAAAIEELPPATRQRAVNSALQIMLANCKTPSEAAQFAQSVLEESIFPEAIKKDFLHYYLIQAGAKRSH